MVDIIRHGVWLTDGDALDAILCEVCWENGVYRAVTWGEQVDQPLPWKSRCGDHYESS
jgi:hypothetical protein